MIIGFTGTTQGMSFEQKNSTFDLFEKLRLEKGAVSLHHGVCIGADAQAHNLWKSLGGTTVGHPGHDKSNRSPKRANVSCDAGFPSKPYLDRNLDIIIACDLLVATPQTTEEEVRSGTWFTIRRAKAAGKRVIIVFPGGDLSEEL